MKRAKSARLRAVGPAERMEEKAEIGPVRAVEPVVNRAAAVRAVAQPKAATAFPLLFTAQVRAIDGERIRVEAFGKMLDAERDAGVHPAVIEGSFSRGERVLVERGAAGRHLVVGALRTLPIPGIDPADEYVIEAKRVVVRASEELSLTAKTASLVLRALGEVETYAERIVSRAEGVHKVIGRMLRLN